MVQGPWIIAQPFKFADKVFPIVFKQRYQLLGLTKWTIETCSSLVKQSYTNLVRIFAFLHSRLTIVSVTGTGGKGSGWHAVFVGGHYADFLCGAPTVGTHMGFTCHGWDCAWIFIPRPSSYRISGSRHASKSAPRIEVVPSRTQTWPCQGWIYVSVLADMEIPGLINHANYSVLDCCTSIM